MNKKAILSFMTVVLLLCGLLALPVRATSSSWSKPRPSIGTVYDETIGNSQTDGVASVGMGVHIYQYIEGVSDEDDFLHFKVSVSANTRVGIQYDSYEANYNWQEVSEPTGITDDNSGTWLDLGFTFLYYGVEYHKIWVCSNGFLTLNNTSTNPNSQSIPSTSEPNPVIAVFWRDLHPEQDGSITYGREIYFNNGYYFVVSWNNVTDDNGDPQTFQVLIENRQGWGSSDRHNIIFFQYKNITKSYLTTVGTEDQVGNKGTSYDYNNLQNQMCRTFEYLSLGCRLEQLWIKLTKSDGYAKIEVEETDTGGCNVKLKDYSNPWGDDFKFVLKTAAGLLLWKAGIVWKGMLIVADLAGVLANDISPVKPEYTQDAWENDNEAWAYGDCIVENRSIIYCRPFDSTLATTISWKFIDANDRGHGLTVTTEAWYRDLFIDNIYMISTSSTLNMYISDGGGGGGNWPCPTLFSWNGNDYVDYGVIDIHDASGEDVIREVSITKQDLAVEDRKAKLRLEEGWEGLNFSESVIDQVKLYSINEDGKLKLCPLTSATHSRLGDVHEYLALSDDVKAQIFLLETIDLTFKVREDSQGFVFVIEGCNKFKM